MGTGTHASQHWAVGIWSNDRGITHHAKGGPPKHELRAAAADSCQWAPALGQAYQSTGFLPQIPTLTDRKCSKRRLSWLELGRCWSSEMYDIPVAVVEIVPITKSTRGTDIMYLYLLSAVLILQLWWFDKSGVTPINTQKSDTGWFCKTLDLSWSCCAWFPVFLLFIPPMCFLVLPSLSVGGPTIHYPIHPLLRRVCYIPNQLLWSGSGL